MKNASIKKATKRVQLGVYLPPTKSNHCASNPTWMDAKSLHSGQSQTKWDSAHNSCALEPIYFSITFWGLSHLYQDHSVEKECILQEQFCSGSQKHSNRTLYLTLSLKLP